MADQIPSEAAYRAAKERYASWTEAQHHDPTPDMLDDVAIINAFESALNVEDDV